MILLMCISLYTSRVLFNTLGFVDYGLYNVVAGVIVVFSYINSSMSVATSRFLTFELGKNDLLNMKCVFGNALFIHICLAFLVFMLGEVIGVYLINNVLSIPDDRLIACNFLFQFVIVMSMMTIITVPFSALVVCHERMDIYAYIGLFDAFAKLLVVYLLQVAAFDKLILYGIFNTLISTSYFLFYLIFDKKKYVNVCHFKFTIKKALVRKMLGFTTWSLIGSTAIMLRNSGVNILINIFFGPVINAANAIAYQVNSSVTGFVTNFTMALNPQIIKSYSSGHYEEMKDLIYRGGKFSFFLLLILCLPLMFCCDYLLRLWLGNYPEYTSVLTRLVLLLTLVEVLNQSVGTAIQATGNIRDYQLVLSGILCLVFPLAYICYKLNATPPAALICAIVVSTINVFIRLIFIKKLLKIDPRDYLAKVICRCWITATIAAIIPSVLYFAISQDSWINFLFVCIVSGISALVSCYLIGLSTPERDYANQTVKKIYNKMIKK